MLKAKFRLSMFDLTYLLRMTIKTSETDIKVRVKLKIT